MVLSMPDGLRIGALVLENPVLLAPMSGVTDLTFRRMARRMGAGLAFSEMIASNAMLGGGAKTLRLLETCAEDQPLAVQLSGRDPAVMAEAARLAFAAGARLIDINMGCPMRKVVSGWAGSALMRDPDLAARIVAAVVKAVPVPVAVKMRAGWDEGSINAPELARIVAGSGASMVTVHGRTRAQLYGGRADWRVVAAVKRAVSIPVIGNGDIASPEEAARLLAVSGADGVMIGRAAMGRPWLPGQIARFLATGEHAADPAAALRRAAMLEHFDGVAARLEGGAGVRAMRRHLAWYAEGATEVETFRAAINRTEDPAAVRGLIAALDWKPPVGLRSAA